MDIQMPEMEGTEATEEILKMFKTYEKELEDRNKIKMSERKRHLIYNKIECNCVALTSYTG
jgi:CheY-like chemotaxis protein